jgi:hypothetical protein
MATSFLVRNFDVEIDRGTWLTKPCPPQLKNASGKTNIDVGWALHMQPAD